MSMMAGTRELNAQMNVTPLVDVLLVLLIIFMITVPNDTHGLNARVPQPTPPTSHAEMEETIVLQVVQGANHSTVVRLNREEVAWTDLGVRLREIYKMRATKVIFIRGDKDVEFSHVARAMDLAREADPGIAVGFLGKDFVGD